VYGGGLELKEGHQGCVSPQTLMMQGNGGQKEVACCEMCHLGALSQGCCHGGLGSHWQCYIDSHRLQYQTFLCTDCLMQDTLDYVIIVLHCLQYDIQISFTHILHML